MFLFRHPAAATRRLPSLVPCRPIRQRLLAPARMHARRTSPTRTPIARSICSKAYTGTCYKEAVENTVLVRIGKGER